MLELGIGGGGLTRKLLPMIARKHGVLVAADSNKQAISRMKISFAKNAFFEAVLLDADMSELAEKGPFDLLVSANGLHMLSNCNQTIASISPMLGDGGMAVVSVSEPDVFHDLVFGPVDGWFDWSVDILLSPLTP